jgi:hypothetical protein
MNIPIPDLDYIENQELNQTSPLFSFNSNILKNIPKGEDENISRNGLQTIQIQTQIPHKISNEVEGSFSK